MKFNTAILLLLLALGSCGPAAKKQADFGGGKFVMALENSPSSFNTPMISDYYSAILTSQVTEGLVSMNPKDLTIRPQLAKSWKISDDGKKYTFTLREEVYFHPHKAFTSDEERKVTTRDILFTVKYSCRKTPGGETPNAYNFLYKNNLKGADDYFNGKASEISGIQITDKTVSFTLLEKDNNFLYKLANINGAIISEKVYKAKGEQDLIGTGPFIYSAVEEKDHEVYKLNKNPEYYLSDSSGNALPYLDELHFVIENRKLHQLEMFENGELDIIIGLPTSRITKMLDGRIKDFNSSPPLFALYNQPLLWTNYYIFNMEDERFKEKKVRQAFNYAINREKINQEILRGQSYEIGIYGIVPPVGKSFKGYDFKGVKNVSFQYDPEKARKLLAEAGYPDGEGFGTVELRYDIGDINSGVADEISRQIKQVLNINVNIDGSTFEQKADDAAMGKGDLFRSAWSADYPSPETFLMNFYGKVIPQDSLMASYLNNSRYRNPQFDAKLEEAKSASKQSDQIRLFSQAEQILMSDPPIIPLWYSGDYQIIYYKVRNFRNNPLNLFDFREIYKKEWTEAEYQQFKSEK